LLLFAAVPDGLTLLLLLLLHQLLQAAAATRHAQHRHCFHDISCNTPCSAASTAAASLTSSSS
jgi:hypothetical protein